MRSAAELSFGNLVTTNISSYDSTKLNIGKLIQQYNGGGLDSFVGPSKIGIIRPFENTASAGMAYIHVINWSSIYSWIFIADTTSAAATRKVFAYIYNKIDQTSVYKGFITLTFPTVTNHTTRTLRVTYDTHYTGTIETSGTSVTGSSTSWSTNRISAGSRIGFGSTDPTQISSWYEISSINSNTSITLSTNPGNISAGTQYVIEELRVLNPTTNATTTNGGVFLTKGLHIDCFLNTGLTISAATTIDKIRAVYWLKDAATQTNISTLGLGLDDKVDHTSQDLYVLDTVATPKVYKYNIRADLTGTLTSGASTAAYVLTTGTFTPTGTIVQGNNGRLGTLDHGPGAGVKSLYFCSTTRIYRAAISNLTSGATNWISDSMIEVPPGTSTTYTGYSTFNSVEISNSMDALVISTNPAQGGYSTITKYNAIGAPADRVWLNNDAHINQTTASSQLPIYPRNPGSTTSASIWVEDGLCYYMWNGTSATSLFLWVVPLGADFGFTSGVNPSYVITPAIPTQNVSKYYKVYVNSSNILGDFIFGSQTEPYKLFYRTTGIVDNSGAWTEVNSLGDLSTIGSSAYIQFKFEFRIISVQSTIPARIHSIGITYETDESLPSELRWNLDDSNNTNGTIGFTQSAYFSSFTKITIYYNRTDTGTLLLQQDSNSTAYGTFQYWNGSTWTDGIGTNVLGTRRRFVPSAGLPAGVDVYARIVIE